MTKLMTSNSDASGCCCGCIITLAFVVLLIVVIFGLLALGRTVMV